MNFDEAVAEAVQEGDSEVTYIRCLTLDHPVLSDPIRVAVAFESFEVSGVKYQAYPFKLRLPTVEDGANSVMSIDIDNVGADIMQSIHQASRTADAVKITYEEFMQKALVFTLAASFKVPMDLANVSRSFKKADAGVADVLTLRCEHVNLINQMLAHERYLAADFPGLLS